MNRQIAMFTCMVLAVSAGFLGCARAARDTSGFALREETVINSSFDDVWHAVKRAAREQGYDIYTRDKRGVFVIYTPLKRILWTQPRRTKLTVELAQQSAVETALSIESVRQVYGVTLLTHPNWHDRKQTDQSYSQLLLEGILAQVASGVDNEELEDTQAELSETTETVEEQPLIDAQPLPAEQEAETAAEEAEEVSQDEAVEVPEAPVSDDDKAAADAAAIN